MQTLAINPAIPFVRPDAPITIVLVGCGGTGSFIANGLARLAAHCRMSGGPQLTLLFMDGDRVEPKNIGRQWFCAAEVGRNKAETLADRLNAALGLNIQAHPMMLSELGGLPQRAGGHYGIIIGAVDGAEGRKGIVREFAINHWHLWIDSGNHEHSGQVVAGTATERARLRGAFRLGGVCAALPAPSLVYPDLLKTAPIRPRQDCAAAMEDNAQGLCVNQMMASIVGQYVYQVVIHRQLTTFETVVDLQSLSMRSTPITAQTVARAAGVSEVQLRGQNTPRQQKARAAA